MRGRYYLKHTINHMVDNSHRAKKSNEHYKSIIKQNAIDYLRNSKDTTDKKVAYLKGLTHDVYRYGTKYKYNCNLNNSDIRQIILKVNDDKLYFAYFGSTIQKDTTLTLSDVVIFVVIVGILAWILNSCTS